jgi:ATP-dependent protease HslVU (ClpYQ) peptidase subunit
MTINNSVVIGSDGNVSLGATYTHSTALDAEAFGFAKKLIAGQYFEV